MSSKLESDVCCRLQVALSSESYGGNLLAESNGSLLSGLLRDWLHVTCGLTACTPGSAPAQCSVTSVGKLYLFNVCDLVLHSRPSLCFAFTSHKLRPPNNPSSIIYLATYIHTYVYMFIYVYCPLAAKGWITHTHTHTRLMALFRDYPGEPVPER